MSEDMTPMPEDPYGIAKYAVEQDLKASHEMFGLNSIIFRPHNVYGEYQNLGDKYRNVVGIFMNQLMLGMQLTIFGDGSQTRAFSYIGDVAPYIAKSPAVEAAYNKIFNIGADQEYTVKELAETVMNAMGVREELRFLDPRNEVMHAYADHSLAESIFGIDKFTSLEEGITLMTEWAKTAGIRKSQKFQNIEIEENLPPVWVED